METDYTATIRDETARAHELAEAGKFASAVQSFALARTMVVDLANAKAVKRALTKDYNGFAREREVFRDMIAGRETAGQPLVIFSDSLGLPRPEEKTGPQLGCELTYPWLIGDTLGNRPIISLCQRYFTTQDVVAQLALQPDLGAGADVLIHVGLNDSSYRMFLVAERLAMKLLPMDLRLHLVQFSQQYRRHVIRLLPPRHYVSPQEFCANLDHILLTLRARKARRIALATVILPPERAWDSTPGVNAKFAAYNTHIMQATLRHNALLLEIDREIWQDQPEHHMADDGIHLSARGHKLVAAIAADLFTRPGKRLVTARTDAPAPKETEVAFGKITDEVQRAQRMADAGKLGLAAQSFVNLRGMIADSVDPAVLRQAVVAQRVPLRAAREAYRAALAGHGLPRFPLLILTDAAAHPLATSAMQATFPWMLGQEPYQRRVTCIGQQSFVAADILSFLTNAPKLGVKTDVMLMIGQTDSAQPLLNISERAALDLLPSDLGAMVAQFVANHGPQIASYLPPRSVVAPDMFRANVNSILQTLRRRGARKIFVVTIPSGGDRAAHNLALLEAAQVAGAVVIDFDRIVRHIAHDATEDGHWSERQHALFVATAAAHFPVAPSIPNAPPTMTSEKTP